jgi:hypothetical protein
LFIRGDVINFVRTVGKGISMAKPPPPDLLSALKAAREQSQGKLPSPSKPKKDEGLTLEIFAKAFAKAKNLQKFH